ncbi:MAG: Spy/CpxP family protein refolding chaperone [Burkholderiales bacterium]
MKRWIKRTLVAVFGTAFLIGGLTACGTHRGGWNNMSEADSAKMRERVIERAGKELKLDDAQKQKLATLADKLRDARVAMMGTTDPRADMQALVAGPKFDRTNAQALVEAKTAAVRTKSPELIAAAADFFDSLKPEQQQQVREFMNKRRGHRS